MLRYVKNGMLLLSVAYIVIGMLLLIMPETSLLWICNIFGVVVLVTGIVCLIQYARIRGTGFTAPFMLVGGVITAGLGIFTLAKPQVVTSFLPVVFGIFIVVDGLSRIGTAIDLAKRKGQKWWLLLLFSIVSVALGVLLVLHPFDVAVSAVMLCGILLIAEGALNLGCILYAAMELRTLDRMASAAANAALDVSGLKSKAESALRGNADRIAEATGMSSSQMDAAIDALEVGDVITFEMKLDGSNTVDYNTHRITAVERNENGTLVSVNTKGDNNDLEDGAKVARGTIIALYTGSKILPRPPCRS